MKTKVVIFPDVARKLLHLGYELVDIKPKYENPVASLFIFKVTGNFRRDFECAKRERWEKIQQLQEEYGYDCDVEELLLKARTRINPDNKKNYKKCERV